MVKASGFSLEQGAKPQSNPRFGEDLATPGKRKRAGFSTNDFFNGLLGLRTLSFRIGEGFPNSQGQNDSDHREGNQEDGQ